MDIIKKFTKPGDLVMDHFFGTFSVVTACMLLPDHRIFDGFDNDEICLEYSKKTLLALLARQLLKPNSDIDDEGHYRLYVTVLLR